ncbi:hypothetical protein EJ02DRAFT_491923 [Clathrospora elynae]|uniref:Uncharacterized protein n=1 Tax=Clathrospora elynae TaxID=706981 RepID=A0A6A5T3X7_9PLEO|nr:hypothetical protein EJ02DRAFT_491923 [Clathrospora elynae]
MALTSTPDSTQPSTVSKIHEHKIPSPAALVVISRADLCYTELSFCHPTSLAFAKPNRINEADAHLIAHKLVSNFGQTVTPKAIQSALLFGSTYLSPETDEELGKYPYLFVVFPNLKASPACNEIFLEIWHNDIVKPAFDGAATDSRIRILPPSKTRTPRDALSVSGFLEHLRNKNPTAVRDRWPVWIDDWHLGTEGQHTGIRPAIYSEAWQGIKGILKEHLQLPSYQNPILLALCRGRVYVGTQMSSHVKFKSVTQEWDRFVDARSVTSRSFKVVLETVEGTVGEGARQLGMGKKKPMQTLFVGDAVRMNFKRMGEGNNGGYRNRRVKMASDGT